MTLAEIAERMMRERIDIPTISKILSIEIAELEVMRDSLAIPIERDDVVESMTRLGHRAFEKGMEMLEYGSPAVKMAMVRMMMMLMRQQMGQQSPKEMAGLVAEFRESIELGEDDDDDDTLPDEEIEEDEAPPLNAAD